MANTSVGSAYVTLMPSMKGFSKAINSELKNVQVSASVATSLKKETSQNAKAFSDFGKNSGSNFAEGLTKGVQTGTSKIGSIIKTGFTGSVETAKNIASGIATHFKNSFDEVKKAAEITAAATMAAMGTVSLAAYNNYASYEQLVGGVEKIFGDSADAVIKNADAAYKNAQMDANTYMETVTGFSASLLQGLAGDTKKAAQIANIALEDMSDNANTFGSDLDSIRFAYQGFAKQTYTMLD